MKSPMKLLGIALPLATVFVLTVLVVGSGVPQIGEMPDMIVTVFELSVQTLYAIAIGGSAAVAMQMTGMNITNERRCVLLDKAADAIFSAEASSGQTKVFSVRMTGLGAVLVLAGETLAWFGWCVLWAFVYLP